MPASSTGAVGARHESQSAETCQLGMPRLPVVRHGCGHDLRSRVFKQRTAGADAHNLSQRHQRCGCLLTWRGSNYVGAGDLTSVAEWMRDCNFSRVSGSVE